MNIVIKLTVSFLALLALGCSNDNVLTKKELANQDNSAKIVTEVLFENEADEMASYNIRKDGYIVISFDSSVPENKYTTIVNQLRNNKAITGVWAEQGGVELCPVQ